MNDWDDKQTQHQILKLLQKIVEGQMVMVAELAAIRRGEQELIGSEVREIRELRKDTGLLREIAGDLKPKLSFIKIVIGDAMPVGPATLAIGDKKVVSVQGFDQNGAAFAIDFTANPVAFSDDNQAAVADTPGSTVTDPITALAAGVANITATCAGFSDTEAVTVLAAAPVLSSIKISID